MKTIASLAVLGLAYGSEDSDLFRVTTFRPVRTNGDLIATGKIGNHYSNHPLRIETPQIATQLEDQEFFGLEDFPENELANFFGKAGSLMTKKKDDLKNSKKNIEKAVPTFDDEFFPIRIRNNTGPIYYDDNELFNNKLDLLLSKDNVQKMPNVKNIKVSSQHEGDALAGVKELIKEGISLHKEVAKKEKYANLLNEKFEKLQKFLNVDDDEAYFTIEESNDDELFQVCFNYRGGKICHNK
jgi:hypothetical protein